MGISPQLLSMTLAGRRATKERLDQLIKLGIPVDLLPTLKTKKKPGPKPNSYRA